MSGLTRDRSANLSRETKFSGASKDREKVINNHVELAMSRIETLPG